MGRVRHPRLLLTGIIFTACGLIAVTAIMASGAIGSAPGVVGYLPLIGPAVMLLFGLVQLARWGRRAIRI